MTPEKRTPPGRPPKPRARRRPSRTAPDEDAAFERLAGSLGPDLAEEVRRTAGRRLDAAYFTAEALTALERGEDADAAAAARRAKDAGGRTPSIREVLGVAAYRCGGYKDAMRELLAFRRMTGERRRDPLIADCYRAEGRSQRALEFLDALKREDVDAREWAEAIVVRAGALDDLGDPAAAAAVLALARLGPEAIRPAGSLRPGVARSTGGSRRPRNGTRSARRNAP